MAAEAVPETQRAAAVEPGPAAVQETEPAVVQAEPAALVRAEQQAPEQPAVAAELPRMAASRGARVPAALPARAEPVATAARAELPRRTPAPQTTTVAAAVALPAVRTARWVGPWRS